MKSILDYPSTRLVAAMSIDPMIRQTHDAFQTIRCDESVLVEQLLIEQSKVIQRLKTELITMHECATSVHIAQSSRARTKRFLDY